MEVKPTDNATIFTIIGAVGAACGVLFGYVGYLKGTKKDSRAAGEKSGTLLTEIGYIKSGIDDIKRKQERQDEQHIDTVKRLAAVEASAKQAHKRLDELAGIRGRVE